MKIEVRGLKKNFGETKALNGISFIVNKGESFGLLGRNGAGKTTTIRILLGIIDQDDGIILIDGENIRNKNVKFGYLPEERGLYLKYKVWEQLCYFAELNGIKKTEAKKRINKYLEEFNISDYYNKRIQELSKGNKQKIQLIAALVHEPDIIILDEPFSGLDPVNVNLFKKVIKSKLNEKKTVIFSSHQMNDVEEFCKDVALFKSGKIVLSGNLEEIKDKYKKNRIEVKVELSINEIIKKSNLKIIENCDGYYIIEFNEKKEVEILLNNILKEGISIEKFNYMRPSLNEIFIEQLGD